MFKAKNEGCTPLEWNALASLDTAASPICYCPPTLWPMFSTLPRTELIWEFNFLSCSRNLISWPLRITFCFLAIKSAITFKCRETCIICYYMSTSMIGPIDSWSLSYFFLMLPVTSLVIITNLLLAEISEMWLCKSKGISNWRTWMGSSGRWEYQGNWPNFNFHLELDFAYLMVLTFTVWLWDTCIFA